MQKAHAANPIRHAWAALALVACGVDGMNGVDGEHTPEVGNDGGGDDSGGNDGGGCVVIGGATGASGTGAAYPHAWLAACALCLRRRIRRGLRRAVATCNSTPR